MQEAKIVAQGVDRERVLIKLARSCDARNLSKFITRPQNHQSSSGLQLLNQMVQVMCSTLDPTCSTSQIVTFSLIATRSSTIATKGRRIIVCLKVKLVLFSKSYRLPIVRTNLPHLLRKHPRLLKPRKRLLQSISEANPWVDHGSEVNRMVEAKVVQATEIPLSTRDIRSRSRMSRNGTTKSVSNPPSKYLEKLLWVWHQFFPFLTKPQ